MFELSLVIVGYALLLLCSPSVLPWGWLLAFTLLQSTNQCF